MEVLKGVLDMGGVFCYVKITWLLEYSIHLECVLTHFDFIHFKKKQYRVRNTISYTVSKKPKICHVFLIFLVHCLVFRAKNETVYVNTVSR